MSEPVWIEPTLVFAIHDRQLAEHGGAEGARDESLLHSALARPLNQLLYTGADIVDLVATYTAGIVQNHPFVDGNKRTGFVVGVLFLELNGYRFTATEEDATQAVLSLAAGSMDHREFAVWLRASSKPSSSRPRRR